MALGLHMRFYFIFSILLVLSISSLADEPENLDVDEESLIDANFDGKPDLYYSNSEHSYTMYVDRDFDGEHDERYQFDNATDFLIGGRLDDDFDGYFETQVVMANNLEIYRFVDSDNDSMIDIVYELKDGVLVKAKKFNPSENQTITEVSYEFGFPSEKTESKTDLTVKEFHKFATDSIPNPITMPSKK